MKKEKADAVLTQDELSHCEEHNRHIADGKKLKA